MPRQLAQDQSVAVGDTKSRSFGGAPKPRPTSRPFATPFAAARLPVHRQFAAQADRRPGALAVAGAGSALTYGELASAAGRLARRLRRLGVGREARVAVCMERSVDLLLALLAVLKSGAYYVPLDPHNPSQRLRGILDECDPAALLSDNKIASSLEESLQLHMLDSGPVPLRGTGPESSMCS